MRALLIRLAFAAGMAVAAGTPAQVAEPAKCGGADLGAELLLQRPADWVKVYETAQRTPNARAVFWRVTGGKGPPSYLFGTIHLTDDRITALPAKVEAALNEVSTVALEIADLSPENLSAAFTRMQKLLVFGDGRSLKLMLTADEQQIAGKAIEKTGMPAAALAALRPWVVTMTMALSDCERQRAAAGLKPLDVRLGERARERGIALVGLETMEDQLRAMAAVPDEAQLTVLKAGLKLYSRSDDMLETMVRRYMEREIGVVWPLQEDMWRQAGFEPSAFAAFQHELVTVRNRKMRDAALPLLAAGGAFIAVGALHLLGGDGLVTLIQAAGYTVEPAE